MIKKIKNWLIKKRLKKGKYKVKITGFMDFSPHILERSGDLTFCGP